MLSRTQITAILVLFALYWGAILLARQVPLSFDMIVPFGTVVGTVSLTLLAFEHSAWKWPIFRPWLIKRPVLHGTWKAELQSSWIDPETGSAIAPIQGYIIIRQTASRLSIRLVTKESNSETVSAGIETCNDDTFEVSCTYRNKPKSMYRHRSEVHYGAMLLAIANATPTQIEGEYWTDRKTTGSLTLTEKKSEKVMTFQEAEKLFSSI